MPYDPCFIAGETIPLPTLGAVQREEAFRSGAAIDHSRFSIVFNQVRGLATLTASHIDGARLIPVGRIPRRDRFRLDPTVPEELQIQNRRGYRNNHWDRGHLVRRRSQHWGRLPDARLADSESFFWTNVAPQHARLHSSAWGRIENWMLDVSDDRDRRACVFTGPVLTPDDPEYKNHPDEDPIRIPAGYWKLIALRHQGRLRAAGFLVWQRDFDRADPVAFDPVLEQVRLSTLEFVTGLGFGALRQADPLRFGSAVDPRAPGDEVALEAPAPRSGRAISSAADIEL